nr:hypothetical protein [Tanacetum cinerariifolium]
MDIPLDSVEVLRYEKRSKSEIKRKVLTEMELLLEQTQQEHQSDTKVISMKMEILLEPTSNKLLVERFDTLADNPVKEILLKLNLLDHRLILMVLKVYDVETSSHLRYNDAASRLLRIMYKFLDNIVYKTGQTVQTMNMLNNKCRTSFAKPEFLKKAQRTNPRLYDIGCFNDNLALMLAPESDEVIRLEKESRSKLSDLIRPFDYDKLNNLYDLFVPQRENLSEQRYFLERSRLSHTPINNGNSKESFHKQTTLLQKQMDESISCDKDVKAL